mmetsp:Transcript_10220/g.26352  ORF Transcript_10220/g.26352 Transcript_10220/m.26352 type:complete len:422 (-) Transcript_10220:153-1418(-)
MAALRRVSSFTSLLSKSPQPVKDFDCISQEKSKEFVAIVQATCPSVPAELLVYADADSASLALAAVRCLKGHVMTGHISKELWLGRYITRCSSCATRISASAASYTCKDCKYSLCVDCAAPFSTSWAAASGFSVLPSGWTLPSTPSAPFCAPGALLPLTPSDVMTGDILLAGPDWWGIHHIILCRGPMKPASEHMARQLVKNEQRLSGLELFECATIESSRPLKGATCHWYAATTYFGRHPAPNGGFQFELFQIGDVGDGTNIIGINNEPVPVKLLLHPCRPGRGGPPLDIELFKAAVEQSAEASKRWSRRTAISAITARRSRLEAGDYADVSDRARLMEDLKRRWSKGPICSSVAIQIWQRYFELAFGSGPGGEDLAVRHILQWMPVLCDKTAPSALLKALSTCGWAVCQNLRATRLVEA